MAGTDFNRVASRAIRRARDESGLSQAEFAAAISDAMGLKARTRQVKQSTLSGWELGSRQVPAGALLAAVAVAGIPVERALGHDATSDLARRLALVEERLKEGATLSEPARVAAVGVRREIRRRRPTVAR